MKLAYSLAAAAAAALFASGAYAQSAKFAAVYDTDLVEIDTGLILDDDMNEVFGAAANFATLHVPQQKDVLIGVSGQIGIYTLTEAKGNNGSSSTAIAEGGVKVNVRLAPEGSDAEEVCDGFVASIPAAPGEVIFASRLQELSVSVSDDIEVIVGLKLDTTAAHHFNFLGIDLAQGTYEVIACFDLRAFAEVIGDGKAQAKVGLGPRMVTAQEVRAAKGGIVDASE